jgi:hypothetical protein
VIVTEQHRSALRLPSDVQGLRRRFDEAQPFPHVVLDDVLDAPAGLIATAFPDPDWAGWRRYVDDYQPAKLVCSDSTVMPGELAALVAELSAPPFLAFLEAVTGIDKLLPDPYLEGGGLHASGPGGVLAPHTDFHVYPRLDLYRRVNALLYLNEEWNERDGGCLELFGSARDAPVVSVVPSWGRLVVFRTDHRSIHGFTHPIVGDRWRKSIALYYYTALEADTFAGDTNTYWKRHGEAGGSKRRVRMAAYRALLATSRAFSYLAHRVNPNLGSRVRARR